MKIVSITAAALVLASPLGAAETDWQEVFPGVSMRLVAANAITEAGTTWIGLEIDMPADTKTYWRVPGESGIPPRFDFERSHGVSDYQVAWPMPIRETDKGYIDHVYYGHTVLPVELTLDADHVALDADVVLGICSDICVPVAVRFQAMLDFAQPDSAAMLRIRQARAQVPVAALPDDELFGPARYDARSRLISVQIASETALPETVLGDIAGSMALLGPPEHDHHHGTLDFPVLGGKSMLVEPGMDLHLTFETTDGPVEIVRTLD